MKYKTSIEIYNDASITPVSWKESFIAALERHAIDFGKYLNDEGWQEYDESDRWIQPHESRTVYTTKQLYHKFNRSDEPEIVSGLFEKMADIVRKDAKDRLGIDLSKNDDI